MRIVFAGTPVFAAVALKALVDANFDVVLVLTQPDRPAGRGLHELQSEVKQTALRLGLALAQPRTLREDEIRNQLRSVSAEAMVVAAYGLILPGAVLDLFPAGCINIHASLLPRWRGAAPIQRAILAGDQETGISIMRMDQGLDTGPVYLTMATPILSADTARSLHDRLSQLGAACIVQALTQIADGSAIPAAQADEGIVYAHKIAKAEAAIDWRQEALLVDRQVRAFNPVPGAFSWLRGEPVKIWRAFVRSEGGGDPGRIVDCTSEGIDVACGRGILTITELQKAGGRRLGATDFLRGSMLMPGERFITSVA